MTPKLIRSVAAACLAAALLPAQEEEEIILRVSESSAKASSKASGLSSKQMKAIIEKLSDDELSSADRKKVKAALMKMLGDVKSESRVIHLDGTVRRDIETKSKPVSLRWHIGQGTGKGGKPGALGKKSKSSDQPKLIEWAQLGVDVSKAKSIKKTKGANEAYTWLESVEKSRDHAKHEHGAYGEQHSKKGEHDKSATARVIHSYDGANQASIIVQLNKAIELGHGGDAVGAHKAHGIDLHPRAIALLGKPDSQHDVITYVQDTSGDGKAIRWLSTSKQGQGKAKAKGGDLGARATQLRTRLDRPDSDDAVVEYLFNTQNGDGKSERLTKAKKAYNQAKKAYAAAKKAHGKASKVADLFGAVKLDDVKRAQVKDGAVRYVRNQTVKLDDVTEAKIKDGTITYVLNRSAKQGSKKAMTNKAGQFLLKSGNETIEFKSGGNGEDVRVFMRGANGKAKAVKKSSKKGSKKADGFRFEWTGDVSMDVFQGDTKGKGKSKGGSFTFSDVPKGAWHVGTDHKGGIAVVVDDAKPEILELIKGGDAKGAHGHWVVGGDESKEAGAWVAEIPTANKNVRLKLLRNKESKITEQTVSREVLLKLIEGAQVHANEVQVIVESAECPVIDLTEEICEECEEESGNGDVLEMIEEMRAEMRELRDMMREIRGSLNSKRTSSNSAARVIRSRVLPTAVREEDATRLRVRRRETR